MSKNSGKLAEAVIFVDTNFFLHYRQVTEIDWCSFANADTVRLVVTTGTASELNEKKDSGKTKAIKKRANLALNLLEAVLDSAKSRLEIRPKAFLEINPVSFSDFSSHQLDPKCADDVLLLSALHYAQEQPEKKVLLLTADVGLRVKAKHRNLDYLKPDENWKLQAEPDPEAKELQELRAVVHAKPKLAVTFRDGEIFATVSQPSPPSSDAHFVEQIVERLKKIRPTHDPVFNPLLQSQEIAVREYNRQILGFYDGYRNFITEWLTVQQTLSRTVPIKLKIANIGNAPATGPKVTLEFEDGPFELLTVSTFLPTAPDLPPSLDEYLISQMGYQMYEHELEEQAPNGFDKDSGVVRIDGNSVTFYHLPALQHSSELPLATVYACFRDFRHMEALKFSISVLANEIPKIAAGNLNIQIKTTAQNAHWNLPLLKP